MPFAPLAVDVGCVDEVSAELAVNAQNLVALTLIGAPAKDVSAEAKFRNLQVGFCQVLEFHLHIVARFERENR